MEEEGGPYETPTHLIIRSYHSEWSYRNDWINGFSAADKTDFQI